MPDHLGDDMRKVKSEEDKEEKDIKRKFLLQTSGALKMLIPFCHLTVSYTIFLYSSS